MFEENQISPENHDEKLEQLKDAVNKGTIGIQELEILSKTFEQYYPTIPEKLLEDMGFTPLQAFSLSKQLEAFNFGSKIETVPVFDPEDYEGVELPKVYWSVVGLLPEGVSVLAGAPKSHKSFFALQLSVSMCTGTGFMGFDTLQGDVIYLDLESNKSRPLSRLDAMYSTREIHGLHIVTATTELGRIGSGFKKNLKNLLIKFPNTRLVVIDILKCIMPEKSSENMYAHDYTVMSELNEIAWKMKISILLVHHTSKRTDEHDPLNNIQGSTGIIGAAASIIMITQDKRFENNYSIHITGNDIETKTLAAHFDNEKLFWICDGDEAAIERKRLLDRAEVKTIQRIMAETMSWTGNATDLSRAAEALGFEITPELFGKFLTASKSQLRSIGFDVTKERNGESRTITIKRPLA